MILVHFSTQAYCSLSFLESYFLTKIKGDCKGSHKPIWSAYAQLKILKQFM